MIPVDRKADSEKDLYRVNQLCYGPATLDAARATLALNSDDLVLLFRLIVSL